MLDNGNLSNVIPPLRLLGNTKTCLKCAPANFSAHQSLFQSSFLFKAAAIRTDMEGLTILVHQQLPHFCTEILAPRNPWVPGKSGQLITPQGSSACPAIGLDSSFFPLSDYQPGEPLPISQAPASVPTSRLRPLDNSRPQPQALLYATRQPVLFWYISHGRGMIWLWVKTLLHNELQMGASWCSSSCPSLSSPHQAHACLVYK